MALLSKGVASRLNKGGKGHGAQGGGGGGHTGSSYHHNHYRYNGNQPAPLLASQDLATNVETSEDDMTDRYVIHDSFNGLLGAVHTSSPSQH